MNYELPAGHGEGCDCKGCTWNFGYYAAVQQGSSEDEARCDYYMGVWYENEDDNAEMEDVLRAAEQAGEQAYLLLMATAIYNRAQLQAQQPQPQPSG